jgi:hypothetical protein
MTILSLIGAVWCLFIGYRVVRFWIGGRENRDGNCGRYPALREWEVDDSLKALRSTQQN